MYDDEPEPQDYDDTVTSTDPTPTREPGPIYPGDPRLD